MKMLLKTLACGAVAFAFFACSGTDTGTNSNMVNNTDKKSEVDLPPYDPNVVIIENDLKAWMEAQLASGGSEKKTG